MTVAMFHVKQSLATIRQPSTQLERRLAVGYRAVIPRVVGDDRLTVTGGLGDANGTGNDGLKSLIWKVRANLILDLLRPWSAAFQTPASRDSDQRRCVQPCSTADSTLQARSTQPEWESERR